MVHFPLRTSPRFHFAQSPSPTSPLTRHRSLQSGLNEGPLHLPPVSVSIACPLLTHLSGILPCRRGPAPSPLHHLHCRSHMTLSPCPYGSIPFPCWPTYPASFFVVKGLLHLLHSVFHASEVEQAHDGVERVVKLHLLCTHPSHKRDAEHTELGAQRQA